MVLRPRETHIALTGGGGFGIVAVGFVAAPVGFDMAGVEQPCGVAGFLCDPPPVVPGATGFHSDVGGRLFGERAPELLTVAAKSPAGFSRHV